MLGRSLLVSSSCLQGLGRMDTDLYTGSAFKSVENNGSLCLGEAQEFYVQ
jgi:hypothetical protein